MLLGMGSPWSAHAASTSRPGGCCQTLPLLLTTQELYYGLSGWCDQILPKTISLISYCVSHGFSDAYITYQMRPVCFLDIQCRLLRQRRRIRPPPQRVPSMNKAAGQTGRICCELHQLEQWMATAPVTLQDLPFETVCIMSDSWYLIQDGVVEKTDTFNDLGTQSDQDSIRLSTCFQG
jgi:hypothetical protein